MNYKILIVDDETANLRILERLFRSQYTVLSAASGSEGLEIIARHDIALIISDQRMPAMTGIEFLKRAAEMRPQTVRIILTGYTDVNALVEAINSGIVYKYVTKPWINEDLKQTVKRALQHYETVKKQYELRSQNERLEARLKLTVNGFVEICGAMVDHKNPGGNSLRAAEFAAATGHMLDLDAAELEQLSIAARLHKLVYLSVPDHILQKTTVMTDCESFDSKLTENERLLLTHNTESVLKMLDAVPDLEDAASAIRYRHEHFDGSGYPAGLADEQIPLSSRILAVAEAYEQMTASSKNSSADRKAIEQIQAAAGKKFDPEVVKAFCRLILEENETGTAPEAPRFLAPALAVIDQV